MSIIGYLIAGGLALYIAYLGEQRRIGSAYAFFISITLSPIIGLVVTLLSPSLKNYKAYEKNNDTNIIIGIIAIIVGVLLLLGAGYRYYQWRDLDEYYRPNIWPGVFFGVGLLILGYYLNFLPVYEKPEDIEPPKPVDKLPIVSKPVVVKEKKPIKIKLKKGMMKKLLYGTGIILLLLIITNPSAKSFKEYRGENSYSGLKREQNWFIFSIYSDGDSRYLGIVLNFFELNE